MTVPTARRVARRAALGLGGAWESFAAWFDSLGLNENTILLVLAVAIGSTSALGVVAFYRLIDLANWIFYRWIGSALPIGGMVAYRPLLTALGFALAAWIVRRPGGNYDGMNVPDVQRSVARSGGRIPARPALARTAASAVTLGSGGAAGSEGPVAVLGSAIGSFLGRAFRSHPGRTKTLVGAGAAAAISAAFNAPLAGAFFALEEILGTLAVGAFPSVVVSSVVAAVVSHSFLGNHPAFPIPEYGYRLTREVVLFYPLLGVLCGIIAALFVKVFFGTGALVARLRIPPSVLPWLGGAIVGGMVLLSGGLLVGQGHFAVHLDVFGHLSWQRLMALALGSIVATSITLNTGGSGGLFTPSLYVGAATGGAFGVALSQLFPSLGLHAEAYALVGMGAVVAAATAAPITGILLVFEMTNDYAIVVPLMLATVIAYVVGHHLEHDSLYSGWLRRRGERVEHGTSSDVLADLHVTDAFDRSPQVVAPETSLNDLLDHLGRGEYADLPVVDAAGRLIGMVLLADLGRIARDHRDLAPTVTAADLASPVETVAPSDSLLEAIRKMGVRGAPSIPVVDPATNRLLGLIGRAHVLAVYERAAAEG